MEYRNNMVPQKNNHEKQKRKNVSKQKWHCFLRFRGAQAQINDIA